MIDTTIFTPAEAAKISGVNVALQRDWRRRGILPAIEGRTASFGPTEVGAMMALKALADCGLGPLNFKGIASKLGARIVRSALLERSAYQGPAEEYLSGSRDRLDWIGEVHSLDRAEYVWEWRANSMADAILKPIGHIDTQSGYFFIQWADGSFDFYGSPQEPLGRLDPGDPRLAGAIIILDLLSMGKLFVKRSGPFATITDEIIAAQRSTPLGQLLQSKIDSLLADVPETPSGGGRTDG